MISFWFLVSNSWNDMRKYWGICPLYSIGGHSKSTFFWEGGRGVMEKRTKTNRGRSSYHIFSKWSLIVILQVFLLIIMAVWNIKQTIMKDIIQSCQWMTCDRFRQPFLLCTTFRSFLCTVHHVLAHFQQKWLLIHWL